MDGRPTVVDLFAGAGGLSLGFSRAGFSLIAAFDNWLPAVGTYRANLGSHVHQASIRADLDTPAATIYVGGPPCQGFSSAGMRRSTDARNSLVAEFSRLIARKRPLGFVFENVEGFLTGGEGAFVFELLEPLIRAGYRIHLRKVNAANYGVPQHRKRVVAIGGLGWDPPFPSPTHSAFGAPGAHLANSRTLPATPTVREALKVLPAASADPEKSISDHWYVPLTNTDLQRARLLKPGERMRDLPEELWHASYRRRAFRRVMDGTPTERRGGAPSGVRRLVHDEPSKAITAAAIREFIHPDEDRPLTIRECATLQTFPVEFQFVGGQNDRAQLIGNAVPPLLAEVIARSIRDQLPDEASEQATGALLSFVPTLSSGMSPALDLVTARVRRAFGTGVVRERQRLLWH